VGTWLAIFWLVVGIALLVGGAEVMLRGATALARRLGVPTFVIGLTIVAFGTSAPELAAGIGAVLKGESQLVVGAVVGSNIANIGLVLGIAALIRPAKVRGGVVRREVPMMILAALAMGMVMLGQSITRVEAGLLTIALVVFIAWTAYSARHLDPADTALILEAEAAEQEDGHHTPPRVAVSLLLVVLGLGGMVAGSDRAVEGATTIATTLGVPSFVIGLTMVAVGTSLPEVMTSVVAAARGQSDLAVGNVLGSNIFNVFCVVGVSGLIAPLDVPPIAVMRDLAVMLGFSVFLLPVMASGFVVKRWEGGGFLFAYVAYIAVVAFNPSG